MNKGSVFLAMLVSSLMGGIIAIVGYSMLLPAGQPVNIPVLSTNPVSFTSNFTLDTSSATVPEGLNFVFAANSSVDAVVHIRTVYEASTSSSSGTTPFDQFFKDYFGETPQRGGRSRGAGSGVIVDAGGFVVTNHHVVENAAEIEIMLNDNRTFKAKIVGQDPTTDLAVLKIEEVGLPYMRWGNSDHLQLGEWVLAVGNPFEFRSTVTAGIVSAKARNIGILARQNTGNNLQIESFIQTDAAVNPGNSGGALVNLRGELIGINTAIISPTGAFAGYSFAVPVSLVKKVYEDLTKFGTVQRALLGINIVDVSAELAKQEKLDVLRGVYVANVNANSAAADAGLKTGDVIVGVNGKKVNSVSELQEIIALKRPGDQVSVSYFRNGKQSEVLTTLKNQMSTTDVVAAIKDKFELNGATFRELTAAEKSKYKVTGGVMVDEVTSGKWKEVGIKQEFVITKIDKKEIQTIEDFSNYLNTARGEGILLEGVYPNGERAYYGIGW